MMLTTTTKTAIKQGQLRGSSSPLHTIAPTDEKMARLSSSG